jgi:hypothetical protein
MADIINGLYQCDSCLWLLITQEIDARVTINTVKTTDFVDIKQLTIKL